MDTKLEAIISNIESNVIKGIFDPNNISNNAYVSKEIKESFETKIDACVKVFNRLYSNKIDPASNYTSKLENLAVETYKIIESLPIKQDIKNYIITEFINHPTNYNSYLNRLGFLYDQLNTIQINGIQSEKYRRSWFIPRSVGERALNTSIRRNGSGTLNRSVNRGIPTIQLIREVPDYLRPYLAPIVREQI